MWTSIGKLEIKKGLLYYLLLYLFFFFWSFFTLFAFFTYTNVKHLSETFIRQRGISILFYPQKNLPSSKDIREALSQLPYIKEVQIVSPRELLQTLENQIPREILEEKDLSGWFPYLIRVYLTSPEKFSQLKRDLQIWQKMSKGGLELISDPLQQKDIFLWQYSNLAILIFLFLWNLFYFLFFYFVIRSLIHHLKDHNEIFQLLGGNIFHLSIIRFLILALPLFFIFLTSFLVYYLLTDEIIYYFPILKIYPPLNNPFEIFLLFIYFFSLILVYPAFLLILFLKRI